MSFSVSFPSDTSTSDFAEIFDTQIDAYPDSPGKDEAVACRDDALSLLKTLSEGHDKCSGGLSGSVSSSSASFNVSLTFPTVSPTP